MDSLYTTETEENTSVFVIQYGYCWALYDCNKTWYEYAICLWRCQMGQLQLFLITSIKHVFANVHNNRIQTTNHRMNEFRGEHSLSENLWPTSEQLVVDQNDWYQSGTQTCLTIAHSLGALGPCERMGGWIWRLIGQSVDRGLDRRHFTLGAISNQYSLSLLLQPLMSPPRNWSLWQTTCRYRSAIVPCGGAAAVVVQKQRCKQSHTLARL